MFFTLREISISIWILVVLTQLLLILKQQQTCLTGVLKVWSYEFDEKTFTVGWNVPLRSSRKAEFYLKVHSENTREQLGELEQMCPSQLGNVAWHTPVSTESLPCRFLEPQLRALHHCGPKYTRHREKENTLEWECHGISGCGVSGHSLSSAEMHSQGLGAQRNWGGVAFLQN